MTGESLKDDLKDGPWGDIQEFPVWQKISDKIESEIQRGKNKKTKSKISEAKEFVIEPLLESINGSMVLGISNFTSFLEHETIMLEDGATKSVQKMPFFAFISESSLTQNDFDDIISSVKDLAKNVVVDEEKAGNTPVYWLLQKSDQNLEGFWMPKMQGYVLHWIMGKFLY